MVSRGEALADLMAMLEAGRRARLAQPAAVCPADCPTCAARARAAAAPEQLHLPVPERNPDAPTD